MHPKTIFGFKLIALSIITGNLIILFEIYTSNVNSVKLNRNLIAHATEFGVFVGEIN